MVHLSGLLFIVLAQFTGRILASFYFFLIVATFFLYSEHVRREQKKIFKLMDIFSSKLKSIALGLERKDVERPFMGAVWFYLGMGLAFFIFPLNIASAACIMLAVGDALSTLIGLRFGKHRILGKKTAEGSTAFFVSSFFASLIFVTPILAFVGSVVATLSELISGHKRLQKNKFINDNWMIPLFAGLVMFALLFFFGFHFE